MKRSGPIKRKTPLKRTGKLPTRRKTARKWVDLRSRRAAWKNMPCLYGLFDVGLCESDFHAATEPEHWGGRGWMGADEPQGIIPICNRAHMAVGRTKQAKVYGVWIKLRQARAYARSVYPEDYVKRKKLFRFLVDAFRTWVETHVPPHEFSFGALRNWLEAEPQVLSEDVIAKGWQCLSWLGLGE